VHYTSSYRHLSFTHVTWLFVILLFVVFLFPSFTSRILTSSFCNIVSNFPFIPEIAHTRTSLARESALGSLTREPGLDIFHIHFRLVTLHTRMSFTHWNQSPAGLVIQARTCMGNFTYVHSLCLPPIAFFFRYLSFPSISFPPIFKSYDVGLCVDWLFSFIFHPSLPLFPKFCGSIFIPCLNSLVQFPPPTATSCYPAAGAIPTASLL
jgi:hypothetical protein